MKKVDKKSKAIAKRATRAGMPARIASRATRTSMTAQPSTSRQMNIDSSSDSDDDLAKICRICGDKVLETARFKLCILCCGKAHVDCVRTSDNIFTCPNCYSDLDESSDDE